MTHILTPDEVITAQNDLLTDAQKAVLNEALTQHFVCANDSATIPLATLKIMFANAKAELPEYRTITLSCQNSGWSVQINGPERFTNDDNTSFIFTKIK